MAQKSLFYTQPQEVNYACQLGQYLSSTLMRRIILHFFRHIFCTCILAQWAFCYSLKDYHSQSLQPPRIVAAKPDLFRLTTPTYSFWNDAVTILDQSPESVCDLSKINLLSWFILAPAIYCEVDSTMHTQPLRCMSRSCQPSGFSVRLLVNARVSEAEVCWQTSNFLWECRCIEATLHGFRNNSMEAFSSYVQAKLRNCSDSEKMLAIKRTIGCFVCHRRLMTSINTDGLFTINKHILNP